MYWQTPTCKTITILAININHNPIMKKNRFLMLLFVFLAYSVQAKDDYYFGAHGP